MEQKYNKHALYSVASLALALLALASIPFWMKIIDGLPPVNDLDWLFFKLTGEFRLVALNILFFTPYALCVFFLSSATHSGLKAIHNAAPGTRSRFVALVSVTISVALLAVSISLVVAFVALW